MALDSDIRDQAYQFFIQEAPELLQAIESGLLTLAQDRSTAKVHDIMRAAHSIKGAAASVGLEAIKTLAHRLEDMFKGLYSEELEIDADLEGLLLQGYDCLRMPLSEQIKTGTFDAEQALIAAEPIFAQIEASLGDFLNHAEHLPSAVELGVDIAQSIFEVDVAEGLDRLAAIVAHPEGHEVAGELRAQANTFAGLAELLNLPGFGVIAQTAIAALDAHPDQALQVTQIALADFRAGQQVVIAGDRTYGGAPSAALLELAEATPVTRVSEAPIAPVSEEIAEMQAISLEYVFSALEEIRAEVQAGTLSPYEVPEVIPPEAVPLELQLSDLGSAGDVSPCDDVFSLEMPVVEQPESSLEEVSEDTFTEEIATEETPLDPAIAKSRNLEIEALLDSQVIERPASTVAMAGFNLNPAGAEALTPAPSLDDLFSGYVPDADAPANDSALLRVIVFNVGSLSCSLRIESIYKVLKQTQVHGSGLNSIGVAHMGDRQLVVVDLEQRLFQSSILHGSEQRGYLIVAQNSAGEFFGIAVAADPTLMEIPLATIRALPESYHQADTLGIASHVAVIPQAETSMTLFLLDVDRLLTPHSGSSP